MSISAGTAPSPRLREARPGEAAAILPGFEWLFAPPGSKPPDWRAEEALKRLEATLANPDATVWLAETGEASQAKLAGICTAYLDLESVRYGLRCWVEDLAVDPGLRSTGIGAALLRSARLWGRQRGATHLELDSGIKRVDAHRFYEHAAPDWTGKQYAWRL